MSKVIIIEHDNGKIGLYKPTPIEWESKGQTEDDFLIELETTYSNQGITTHGIIDENSVPIAPIGGDENYLIWDGSVLVYDTTAITDTKRFDLNNQIDVLFAEKEGSVQITIDSVIFNDGGRTKQNLGLLAGVVANGGTIPAGAKIRQADGVRVDLTTQLHLDLSNALTIAHSDLLNSLEDHLDAIAVADDSALDSYDVNANWP